jgi:NAD(P)-dependent dehydrogenase (short-subunit alcohol dehydrogenase family)
MSDNKKWTEADIGDLSGKVAVVTGANSGIGYETARALAEKGADVVMACRNLQKGNEAAEQIRALDPRGSVEVMQLDLADLDSVREFAEAFKAQHDRLTYGKTAQGFEQQFGVNHLGHFALTGLLFERIKETPGSRVVTVSSTYHRLGKIDFDDLHCEEKAYGRQTAYGQSKLANLLFTYELQRKMDRAGLDMVAVAAHPGWSETNLQRHAGLFDFMNRFVAQDAAMGALPTLYAATAPDVRGGDYYGPEGFMERAGYPKKVRSNGRSQDEEVAERLWRVSEDLTGVSYP